MVDIIRMDKTRFKIYYFSDYNNKKLTSIKEDGLNFFLKNGFIKHRNKCIDQGSSAIAVKDLVSNEYVGLLTFTYIKKFNFGWMSFVYVDPEFRGMGIFREMFEKFCKIIKKLHKNATNVQWGAHFRNMDAIKLYRRIGANTNNLINPDGYVVFNYNI